MKTFVSFTCITFIIFLIADYAESASSLYKELNFIGGYSSANGFIDHSDMLKNSVGIEYFKRFSGDKGDYVTIDLQPRLTYNATEKFSNAWDLEIHNAWLEYRLGFGYKLRIGHFDPSFGLEPISDTHGTILQTLAMKNIGSKSDWGIGLKGIIGYFDYEGSIQNGTGMNLKRENGSFLLSYRIGNPQSETMLYGLSLMYGKVVMNNKTHNLMERTMPIEKKRIGLDAQIPFRSFLLKLESVYGTEDKVKVLGLFSQINYTFPFNQALTIETQMQNWFNGIDNKRIYETMFGFCVSHRITSKLTIRTTYFYTFDKDNQIFIQLYYLGT